MEKKNSFTFKLNAAQQETLIELLRAGNYRPTQVPYTKIAVAAEGCAVNLYTSGKVLIQGKGAEDFVLFFMEPYILGAATVGYEETVNPEATTPHMGVDESGKGDFFGPLVACAAYVNPDLAKTMTEIGVKDCKLLSDKQVHAIGTKLRALLGSNRYALVMIRPEAYNRLYAKIKSINRLLAWAHARCIENLLERMPSCPRAVADQFGSEQTIKRALMKKGRSIILEQRHKAESDIAVAAASILAREAFLLALNASGTALGMTFPKGASPATRAAAVEGVEKHGVSFLATHCKCHFRTTDQVLAACGKTRAALPAECQVVSAAARTDAQDTNLLNL